MTTDWERLELVQRCAAKYFCVSSPIFLPYEVPMSLKSLERFGQIRHPYPMSLTVVWRRWAAWEVEAGAHRRREEVEGGEHLMLRVAVETVEFDPIGLVAGLLGDQCRSGYSKSHQSGNAV